MEECKKDTVRKDQSNWSSEFGSVKFNCKFKTNTFSWLNQQFKIWGFKKGTKKAITSIWIFKYFFPRLFIQSTVLNEHSHSFLISQYFWKYMKTSKDLS